MPVSPTSIALIRVFSEHFGTQLLQRYQEMAQTGRLDPSLVPTGAELIAGFAELVKGDFLPKDMLGTIATWKPIDDAIKSIQGRLNGILGERTLEEDGILGPRTLKKIFNTSKCDGSLPHNPTSEVASDQTGLSRLVIRYWHRDLRLPRLQNGSVADVIEQAGSAGPQARLSETEKRALIALRKFPHLKKGQIAEKLGIKQGSLSEIAGRLQTKGVIAAGRMPDLRKLPGREMAAFVWVDFSQPLAKEEYEETVLSLVNSTPQLYKMYMSRTFILMISVFHSLDKAESSNLAVLERFGGNLKSLSMKVVPTRHLQVSHSPLFLEGLFRPSQ